MEWMSYEYSAALVRRRAPAEITYEIVWSIRRDASVPRWTPGITFALTTHSTMMNCPSAVDAEAVQIWPRWTLQIQPFVDGSRPAISA